MDLFIRLYNLATSYMHKFVSNIEVQFSNIAVFFNKDIYSDND